MTSKSLREKLVWVLLVAATVASTAFAAQDLGPDLRPDLRPLIEMTVQKLAQLPDDTEVIRIQVFRTGLLHYEDLMTWDRSACTHSYVFALGYGSSTQLQTLDAALTKAGVGTQRGDCTLDRLESPFTIYRVVWVSRNGPRSNDITFYGGRNPLSPDPPPPPCDPKLRGARDAVVAFANGVIAKRATRVASGSACYSPP